MKKSTLINLLAGGAACAVALSTAVAQETSTTTTTGTTGTGAGVGVSAGTTGVSAGVSTGTAGVTTSSSTSSLSGTGTITTYTPGSDYISFRTETTAEPVKYYYTKKTTVVDSDGKTVEWSALRPDLPVRYEYVKDGGRMVVSKVVVTKPLATFEKKESTTTTTTTAP